MDVSVGTPSRTSARLAKKLKRRHSSKAYCPCCVTDSGHISPKHHKPDVPRLDGHSPRHARTGVNGGSTANGVSPDTTARSPGNTRQSVVGTTKQSQIIGKTGSSVSGKARQCPGGRTGESDMRNTRHVVVSESPQHDAVEKVTAATRRRGRPRKDINHSQDVTIIMINRHEEDLQHTSKGSSQKSSQVGSQANRTCGEASVAETERDVTEGMFASVVDTDDMLIQAMCKTSQNTGLGTDRTMIYDAVSALLNCNEITSLDKRHRSWERDLIASCPVRLANWNQRKVVISHSVDHLITANNRLVQMLKTVDSGTQVSPAASTSITMEHENNENIERDLSRGTVSSDHTVLKSQMENLSHEMDNSAACTPPGSLSMARSPTGVSVNQSDCIGVSCTMIDSKSSQRIVGPEGSTILNNMDPKISSDRDHTSVSEESDSVSVIHSRLINEDSEMSAKEEDVVLDFNIDGTEAKNPDMKKITKTISKAQRLFNSMASRPDGLYSLARHSPENHKITEGVETESIVDGLGCIKPVVDEQSNVNVALDEPSDINQVVDEAPDIGPVVDETPDIGQVVDETPDISQVVDETHDINPVVDEPSDISQFVDETHDVNPVVDETSEIKQVVDETSDMNSVDNVMRIHEEDTGQPMSQDEILALVEYLDGALLSENIDPAKAWKTLSKRYTRSSHTDKKVIKDSDLIICDLCDEYSGTSAAIISHKRRCHPNTIYRCDKCHKPFGLKSACFMHRLNHLGRGKKKQVSQFLKTQKRTPVDNAPIQHINLENLDYNMTRANTTIMKNPEQASHKCKFCSYLGTRVGVATHVQRYHPKTVHKCSECDKSFGTVYHLKVHKDSHVRKKLRQNQKQVKQEALLQAMNEASIGPLGDEFKKIHACDLCGFTTTKSGLAQHKLRKHREKVLQCDLCKKWFTTPSELKSHRASHYNSEGNLRKIRYAESPDLKEHDAMSSGESTMDNKEEVLQDEDEVYTCDLCGFQSTSQGLRIHKRHKHREKSLKCSVCCKSFHSDSQLKKHLLSHFTQTGELKQWEQDRRGDQSVKCEDCDDVFTTNRALEIHVSKMHKRVRTFMCEYCLYRGFNKNDVQVHVARKHKSHDHKCDICGKMYAFIRDLERHRTVIHQGLEQCKCPICGQEFKMIRYLKTHMERHDGKFKCYCTTCGKGFMDNCRLKEHEYTHKPMDKREFQYHCEICRKGFIRKSTWNQHMDCHYQNRRHICKICGKGFTLPQTLSKHKMRHKKDKPYPCTFPSCKKQFVDRTTFRAHYVTHTGESSHRCDTCGKYFTQAATLRRHVCRRKGATFPKTKVTWAASTVVEISPQPGIDTGTVLEEIRPGIEQQAILLQPDQLELLRQLENQGQNLEVVESQELTENITIILNQQLEEKYDPEISAVSRENVMIILGQEQQGEEPPMLKEDEVTTIMKENQHGDPVKLEISCDTAETEQFLCSVCEQLFPTWSEIESHMVLHIDGDSETTLSILDPSVQTLEVLTPDMPVTSDLDEIVIKPEVC